MSAQLVFRPAASAEYADAASWYETQQNGLGTAFIQQIEAVLEEIVRQPDRFPKVLRDIREAPVSRFP